MRRGIVRKELHLALRWGFLHIARRLVRMAGMNYPSGLSRQHPSTRTLILQREKGDIQVDWLDAQLAVPDQTWSRITGVSRKQKSSEWKA